VIAGDLAQGKDREAILSILRVLALVQPFSPDDAGLLKLLEDAGRNLRGGQQPPRQDPVTGGVVFSGA
jgi:ABC-type transport system involved in cytochrome bd biosynthesis fused ATPase/permease subunit